MPVDIQALYRRFGLTAAASDQEVKDAWRRLAFELHPDRNQGDARAFLGLREAYDALLEARMFPVLKATPSHTATRTARTGAPQEISSSKWLHTPPNPRYKAEQRELEETYGGLGVWTREGVPKTFVSRSKRTR